MNVTPEDTDNLRHMLGAIPKRYPKKQWGFRNHFCAGRGTQQESMQRLVDAGYATRGYEQEGGSVFFHATKEGCKAVGLDSAGIKRAFEK